MIKTDNYTQNIKRIIEGGLVETRKRQIQIENNKLFTYWNVGKEIVKAYNEDKIRYGNSYVKELSKELTRFYGKGYNYYNLTRMKKFYSLFPNVASLTQHFITWTHITVILPIKNENKRNYYINLVNENSLSVSQLKQQIKNNAYERLDESIKENITLEEKTSTFDLIKDPLFVRYR